MLSDLIVRLERGPWRELYDLRADPYELRNLARDPATALTRARLANQPALISSA